MTRTELIKHGDLWRDFWPFESAFDRLFSRHLDFTSVEERFPAVNLWSSGEKAVVTTEVPGIEPSDIEVTVLGKTLTIKGERKPEKKEEGTTYHQRERWYGDFVREITLPFNVDAGKVEAKFDRGILEIVLPMAESEKPRKIKVG